jgi:hypothetical protein
MTTTTYGRNMTFEKLAKMHDGYFRRKQANNTYSYDRIEDGRRVIVIELHESPIVKFYEDGSIAASLAGWPTVTTRQRVNKYLPTSYRVYQHNYVQYLAVPDGEAVVLDSYDWYHIDQPELAMT